MTAFDPTIDAAFREYAELEIRCHHLLMEGREDSVEIADTEDRMEGLWTKLDDVQRQSLRGMVSDLIWIRRNGQPPPKGRKTPEEVPEAELQELTTAIQAEEWHRILHFLRLCAPVFQSASLAAERGIAYEAIDFPEYARVFKATAVQLVAGATIHGGIPLQNYARSVEVQAIEIAPARAVLVWESNGVKATAPKAAENDSEVEYRACA